MTKTLTIGRSRIFVVGKKPAIPKSSSTLCFFDIFDKIIVIVPRCSLPVRWTPVGRPSRYFRTSIWPLSRSCGDEVTGTIVVVVEGVVHQMTGYSISHILSTSGGARSTVNYNFDLPAGVLALLVCSYASCKRLLNIFPIGDLGI